MENEPEFIELEADEFFLLLEIWREESVDTYTKAVKIANQAMERIGQSDMLYGKYQRGEKLGLKVRFYYSDEAKTFAIGLENKDRIGFRFDERDN